jgi:hypothetical protein
MRKNTFVILLVMGLFLLLCGANASAVKPGKSYGPKSGNWMHSMAPDSSDASGDDSLVVSMAGIVSTWWRQLAPCYNAYHIVDKLDNGDGVLSYCDYLKADWRGYRDSLGVWHPLPPGPPYEWWHVDAVTLTLKLKRQNPPQDTCFAHYLGNTLGVRYHAHDPANQSWQFAWPPLYLVGSDSSAHIDSATRDPAHTIPTDTLRTCMYVHFQTDGWWHVEDIGTDIMVHTVGQPPVPTMTEWGVIILVALILASGAFIILRRKKVRLA